MNSRPEQIGAIVFDMDGIIFDSERIYFDSESELLARRGKVFTRELSQKIMGTPGMKAMAVVREEMQLAEPVEELFDECLGIFQNKLHTELRTMPGALELMDRIEKQGLRKAVATSTGRNLTERMIGQFNLKPRFEFLMTRDDVREGKPNPEIYLKTADRLGVRPGEIVVLEDSSNGARAAKAAGCWLIAIPHEFSRTGDFSMADLVADHLLDPKLLDFCRLLA